GVDSGGVLGLGNVELFQVNLGGANIGDEDLERLVGELGDRAWALDLRRTRVTDAGLKHLRGLSRLAALSLGDSVPPGAPAGAPPPGRVTPPRPDDAARPAGGPGLAPPGPARPAPGPPPAPRPARPSHPPPRGNPRPEGDPL